MAFCYGSLSKLRHGERIHLKTWKKDGTAGEEERGGVVGKQVEVVQN